MTNRAKRVVKTAVGVLLAGAVWFAYAVYHAVYTTIPNAYAVWNVADLVNQHMDANDGAWPRGWDDLRRTDRAAGRNVGDEAFADYLARVEIDWSADPRQLALAATQPAGGDPPFRVIRLRDGSRAHWEGAEPNWLVWQHLQERRRRATTRPTARPGVMGPASRP